MVRRQLRRAAPDLWGGDVSARSGLRPASGRVPALPWKVTRYGQYGEYEGHAFVTMDPKGIARSVCDGFIDDMEWITDLHNRVIADGWRARLARRLLGIRVQPPVTGEDKP